jgi:hypothetical protein
MRFLTVVSVLACCCHLGAGTPAAPPKSADVDDQAVYRELIRTLPTKGQRARSARLELDKWRASRPFAAPAVRKTIKTKGGKPAEIVVLDVPSLGMPGIDFSMAFLLIRGRVVDWASCWTYNRTALQEVRLEDVDGDGAVDLAFRARAGFFGLLDRRQHTRPHDKRVWLYAYGDQQQGLRKHLSSDGPRFARQARLRDGRPARDAPCRRPSPSAGAGVRNGIACRILLLTPTVLAASHPDPRAPPPGAPPGS